jgi:hypothetical protein
MWRISFGLFKGKGDAMKGVLVLVAFLSVFALTVSSPAATIVLDFEGLEDLESVNSFYNGGLGGNGSGPGVNYGIQFSANSLALIDSDAGGTGNIGGEPSPSTVLFFLTGTAVLNYAFDTGFSFFYSAVNSPGVVTVYDGANASGNVLATINLPVTPSNGGDPSGDFSPFFAAGTSFAGSALSVDFGGTVNQIAFDDITFGSSTPGGGGTVPEPASLFVWSVLCVGGVGVGYRRRKVA